MVVLTQRQQLERLQNLRSQAIRSRDSIRRENEDRLRRGLSRDRQTSINANLANRRAAAITQLIELTRRGFILSEGRVNTFIRDRLSGFETQLALERFRGQRIREVAARENISRGQAARSLKFAQQKIRKILRGRPVTRLTSQDLARLSPREKRVLDIRVEARKEIRRAPSTPKKKTIDKPPGIVSELPKPRRFGFQRRTEEIRLAVSKLLTTKARRKLTPKEEFQLAGAKTSLVSIEGAFAGERFIRASGKLAVNLQDPKFRKKIPPKALEIIKKTPSLIELIPSKLRKIGPKIKRTSSGEAVGIIAGNVFTIFASSKAIRLLEKGGTKVLGKAIAKDIKTTPVGTKIIKNVKGVGDIEVIPQGKIPKLKVDPLKAVKQAQLKKQLRSIPKIPKTSKIEKEILKIVKKRGDAVTGSFAQRTLLKKQFARKPKDIDIVTRNQEALKKAIKAKLKGRVRFSTLRIKDKKTGKRIKVIRVIDARTRKLIADLDPISAAEEGFIRKFGLTKHKGLKLVRPEARLAAKVAQLGKITRKTRPEKIKKIKKDIEALTGGRLKPETRGGFGFSKKELQKFVGKVGPITTAQINLLGKGILKSRQLKLKRWLFASPFNPKTGRAQFRVSRLGITKDNEARLLDLLGLGDKVSFRKSKPQIYVFPKEKIFAPGKKIKRKVIGKTPKGFVVPKFSSELEVVLGKGFVIKRVKTLSRVNIEGRIVPIIELKKVKISSTSRNLLSQRSKTLNTLRKGKISTAKIKTLTNKLRSQDARLNRQLKRETGLNYNLGISPRPKRVRFVEIKSKGLSALSKLRKRPSKISPGISRGPVSKRGISPPSKLRPVPRSPGKTPAKSPLKSPPKTLPKSPPKIVPKIPPKGIPKGFPITLRRRRRRISRLRGKTPTFNVEGKVKKRWVRLNRLALSKKDANSRGAWAIDNSTARTFRIRPAGKRKKLGKITPKEKGYFGRKKSKFRDFRIVKGKKKKLINKNIERTRHAIDTRGEKKQLSLARLIKQQGFIRRPQKSKPFKRRVTRRR